MIPSKSFVIHHSPIISLRHVENWQHYKTNNNTSNTNKMSMQTSEGKPTLHKGLQILYDTALIKYVHKLLICTKKAVSR